MFRVYVVGERGMVLCPSDTAIIPDGRDQITSEQLWVPYLDVVALQTELNDLRKKVIGGI